jgi:mono/diheme cytochrome c family protein
VAGAVGIFVFLYAQATPQTSEVHSVWDGVYAAKQAVRGEALFHQNCSTCHGDKLKGRPDEDIPALAGGRFTDDWKKRNVGELFRKIMRTMPQDDPGRMNAQQSADLVAFLLSFNMFPAGEAELPPDDQALSGIRFEGQKHEKKSAK